MPTEAPPELAPYSIYDRDTVWGGHPHRPMIRAVYIFESLDGEILYVGVTGDWWQRRSEHARTKPWWPQVSRVHVLQCPPGETAETELRLIRVLQPLHNIIGTPRDPRMQPGWGRAGHLGDVHAWQRIVDDVTEEITSGRWPIGSLLPSARHMMRDYGVSSSVVRRALEVLTDRLLVEGRERVGTIVISDEPYRSPAEGMTLDERVAALELRMERFERSGCCTCARHETA